MIETDGLIKQGMTSNPEDEYRKMSQGTNTSGLLGGQDRFSEGLGQSAMSEAIRGKYSKPFHVAQQGLQNKIKLDARNEHFQKVLTAHQLANEEANLNFQKELIKYKQKMQKRAMRGQIISNVLGLAGGVVGAVYGGPGGAMVGAAGGQAAGQGIGNTLNQVEGK